MGRRTALLIAALVLAAVGTTMVFLYANSADDRAQANERQVQVLVATAPIAAGTKASAAEDAGSLERKEVDAEDAPETVLSNITPVADQVATSTIFPGEMILSTKFGQPGTASTLPIPPGKLATSVQLDDPARVAGFVAPGSEVAVFLTIAQGNGQEVTRALLPRATVIATGASTLVSTTTTGSGGDTQTEELPKAILTLAVDQTESQKLIYGLQHGQMYFGLLRPDSKVSKADTGATAQNLFD
ncbi:MAG: Flp pilus assembly protein CpaB [Actinomycetes bacterium]